MAHQAESGARSVSSAPERIGPERFGYGLGVGFIVLGGLIAAVTGPLHLERGSWLAAYLVLVCGVAQCLLAHQGRILATKPVPMDRITVLLALWNLGNVLTVVGSLVSVPLITDAGGACLIAAIVLALIATRTAARRGRAIILRAAYVVLALSIPVGLTLTHVRVGHL